VSCPLCRERRARRGCPALDKQICPVCCATKRLIEIQCPSDCAYLTAAREHPSAAAVRQQQRDVGLLVQCMRDLSDRQSQLFFVINTFLQRYEPPALHSLIDDDVAEAAAALAGTFETAARGVIYEHRPAALPAERLATALRPVLAEAGKHAGSAFDRDAAVVLRRIEAAARELKAADPSSRRAYLDVLGRVLTAGQSPVAGGQAEPPAEPRLIVP
jgi:hypothetical protein